MVSPSELEPRLTGNVPTYFDKQTNKLKKKLLSRMRLDLGSYCCKPYDNFTVSKIININVLIFLKHILK